MPLTCELLLLGYIQKLTLFKKHNAFFSFVSKEERASFNTRTQRHSAGQGVQSWEGWGEGSAKEPRHRASGRGCGALGKKVRFLEGRLICLTTYFFICFIQFLQRVQQFLWGENVRGSWGAEKRVSLPALVLHTSSFPALLDPTFASISPHPPWSWSLEAGRGLGIGVWGHVIGLGDIWKLWINETRPLAQAGSQAAPRKEHASPSGLSAICQGTGQLPFELKGKPGRQTPNHKAGEKVGSGAGVTWGLCGKNGTW